MEIYCVNIAYDLNLELYYNFLNFIDKEKRCRIEKFRNKEDVIRSLVGDVLIRCIICERVGILNKEIRYEYNDYGKPKIYGINNCHFNISHSGKWVFVIIDDNQIGIDVELINQLEFLEIVRHFFSLEECLYIKKKKIDERIKAFFKLWTLKESYIKMVGEGLSIPLNEFTIEVYEDKLLVNESIIIKNSSYENLHFKTYEVDRNYQLAVCSLNSNFPSNFTEITYEDLYKKTLYL